MLINTTLCTFCILRVKRTFWGSFLRSWIKHFFYWIINSLFFIKSSFRLSTKFKISWVMEIEDIWSENSLIFVRKPSVFCYLKHQPKSIFDWIWRQIYHEGLLLKLLYNFRETIQANNPLSSQLSTNLIS